MDVELLDLLTTPSPVADWQADVNAVLLATYRKDDTEESTVHFGILDTLPMLTFEERDAMWWHKGMYTPATHPYQYQEERELALEQCMDPSSLPQCDAPDCIMCKRHACKPSKKVRRVLCP